MENYKELTVLNTIVDKLVKIEDTLAEMKSAKTESDVEEFLNLEDLCWKFKLSKDSVRRYRREGIIPSYKIKGKVYFNLEEVKKSIKEKLVHGSNRSK